MRRQTERPRARRARRRQPAARSARRGASARARQAPPAAADTADPFRHVVLLMLENRSFDHMVGSLQSVVPDIDGVPPGDPARTNPDSEGDALGQLPNAPSVVDPDPKHETPNVLRQLANGNTGFAEDYDRAYPGLSPAQKQAVMAYYPLGALPALHALARSFAVCDRWFSSVPGPTWPNRLFAMSGTSLGRVTMPDGLFHPNIHWYGQPSIFRRIEEAGRSARVYFGDVPSALLLADRRRPSAARGFSRIGAFFADAAGDESAFPDFASIEPRYLVDPNDDHPPHDVSAGEELVARVYDAIRANPALWTSTLLVIAYDEHGGFYDHVAPPAAEPPDDHREEFGFDRLGVRVAVVLVSPWIEPQAVHTACDHTALLRSLQVKWGLGDLGRRVAAAPDILADVRLAQAAREDTPEGLPPGAPARRLAAPRPTRVPERLNDHQRALVAFTQYLESRTVAPPEQKVRAAARAMRSPGDAARVAEERTRRYLAQLQAGAPARRARPTRRRRR